MRQSDLRIWRKMSLLDCVLWPCGQHTALSLQARDRMSAIARFMLCSCSVRVCMCVDMGRSKAESESKADPQVLPCRWVVTGTRDRAFFDLWSLLGGLDEKASTRFFSTPRLCSLSWMMLLAVGETSEHARIDGKEKQKRRTSLVSGRKYVMTWIRSIVNDVEGNQTSQNHCRWLHFLARSMTSKIDRFSSHFRVKTTIFRTCWLPSSKFGFILTRFCTSQVIRQIISKQKRTEHLASWRQSENDTFLSVLVVWFPLPPAWHAARLRRSVVWSLRAARLVLFLPWMNVWLTEARVRGKFPWTPPPLYENFSAGKFPCTEIFIQGGKGGGPRGFWGNFLPTPLERNFLSNKFPCIEIFTAARGEVFWGNFLPTSLQGHFLPLQENFLATPLGGKFSSNPCEDISLQPPLQQNFPLTLASKFPCNPPPHMKISVQGNFLTPPSPVYENFSWARPGRVGAGWVLVLTWVLSTWVRWTWLSTWVLGTFWNIIEKIVNTVLCLVFPMLKKGGRHYLVQFLRFEKLSSEACLLLKTWKPNDLSGTFTFLL